VITSSRSTSRANAPRLTIPKADYVENEYNGRIWHSTKATKSTGGARHGVVVARNHAGGRSGSGGKSRVAAKHGDAGAVLGTTKRDHVLADMAAHNLAMLGATVGQDVLDEVVSELIPSNFIH
jgi:hypothetical protein